MGRRFLRRFPGQIPLGEAAPEPRVHLSERVEVGSGGSRALIETPREGDGSAGVLGILRLRLCIAFAPHNLRSG
jgi:hypothetical protein